MLPGFCSCVPQGCSSLRNQLEPLKSSVRSLSFLSQNPEIAPMSLEKSSSSVIYVALHLTPKPGLFLIFSPRSLSVTPVSWFFSNMLFTQHIVSICCSFCLRSSSQRRPHDSPPQVVLSSLGSWHKGHLLRPHLDTGLRVHTLLITLPGLIFLLGPTTLYHTSCVYWWWEQVFMSCVHCFVLRAEMVPGT